MPHKPIPPPPARLGGGLDEARSRWQAHRYRYLVVVYPGLFLHQKAVLVASPAQGAEHLWGEAVTEGHRYNGSGFYSQIASHLGKPC